MPKEQGADRELLFVELSDVRNVVPIIDRGETDDRWVLAMPRAEQSLREHLDETGGPLGIPDAVAILVDIAMALTDLDGKVVHRDLKPENVLLLDRHWCLADFGISRYADASTARDTRKYMWTPEYAAPEQWRAEHATIATDVYAFGIIVYELLTGSRPFDGGTPELREQHLHTNPEHLTHLPAVMAALIEECLYKAPGARPRPGNILARLRHLVESPSAGGLASLQEANRAEVLRRGEVSRQESESQSEAERRTGLVEAARLGLGRITDSLWDSITAAAPSVTVRLAPRPRGADPTASPWSMTLGSARLQYNGLGVTAPNPWGSWDPPAIDVIAHASLALQFPADRSGYEGRSHSLWFCDAHEAGQYQWFEIAFMHSAFLRERRPLYPFALNPGEQAAKALWPGIAEFQVAWPFTVVEAGDLDEFIGRWAGWLADAAQGQLHTPHTMPERPVDGTWRRM